MILSPPSQLSQVPPRSPLQLLLFIFVIEPVAHTAAHKVPFGQSSPGKGLMGGGVEGVVFSQITNSSQCLVPSLSSPRSPMTNAC